MSEAEPHADFESLLALATPLLYRRNPFRVLGRPISTSLRDARRVQARREMQAKLGIGAPDAKPPLPGLSLTPQLEDVREAIDRLSRPLDRLLAELFWFWPLTPEDTDDAALAALEHGRIEDARAIWQDEPAAGESGAVAAHNLVVLDHLFALDAFSKPATGELERVPPPRDGFLLQTFAPKRVEKREQERLDATWHGILRRWKQVVDDEAFWNVVRNRIRRVNDAQVTTGVLRRIRTTLPTALLAINARLAHAAAEAGDGAFAERQIRMLRGAPFPPESVERAVREALKPVRNRIKAAADTTKARCTETPHCADVAIRALHVQAKDPLRVVDLMLPPDDPTRIGLHDTIAEAMLLGQISFASKTNDWADSIQLLQLARSVAEGASFRARIDENLAILRSNIAEGAVDWYCREYWDLPQETVRELEIAHQCMLAGDFDGALKRLLVLDETTGKPLRRSLACALTLKAVRIFNAAAAGMGETQVLRGLLARLRVLNYRFAAPLPDMPAYMPRPPCLACGSTHYTSWTNFTLRDDKLFMCTRCWSEHEQQTRALARAAEGPVRESLEHFLLADELAPNQAGLKRSLDVMRSRASAIGCHVRSTTSLRQTLSAHNTRGVRRPAPGARAPGDCFFCGSGEPDAAWAISVTMCGGELRPVRMLLAAGQEYGQVEISVPRCRSCRDEHHDFPKRRQEWLAQQQALAEDKNFPDAMRLVATADKRLAEARGGILQWGGARAAAFKDAELARTLNERCDRCQRGPPAWRKLVCKHCDAELFQLGGAQRTAILAASTALGIGALLMLQPLGPLQAFAGALARELPHFKGEAASLFPNVLSAAAALLAGGATMAILRLHQLGRRRVVSSQRKPQFAAHKDAAIKAAAEAQVRAETMLAAVEETVRAISEECEAERRALAAAKQAAMTEFERRHPRPELAEGVRPETDYLSCPSILELQRQGWGFGLTLGKDLKPTGDARSASKGLLAAE